MPNMDFGITFKGDIDPKRTVSIAKRAEEVGFDYIWSFDSYVLNRGGKGVYSPMDRL